MLWGQLSFWWRPPAGVVQWHRVTPVGWLCGTTTSTSAADEDLDEEEMDLVRTEGPDLSPLECSSAAEVQSFI